MPSQQSSSTTQTSMPGWIKDKQNYQLGQAIDLYKTSAPQYVPWSTVAPQNQYQTQAMDLASQGAAGKLDPVFENVRSKVMPAIDSAYSRGGRRPTGAGGYGAAAADALTNAYAPVAQQQYNTDYGRLYQAGQDQNQYQQAQIQDATNRFNYYQNLPWDQLGRLQQGLSLSSTGGYGNTTQPYYQNPYLQGAGAGAQLLGALAQFYGR
jgi:hypothetical protein